MVTRIRLSNTPPRRAPTDREKVLYARAQEILAQHFDMLVGREDSNGKAGVSLEFQAGHLRKVRMQYEGVELASGE